MTTAAPHTPDMDRYRDDDRANERGTGLKRSAQGIGSRVQPAMAFWTKITNDWVFDFSGELAYTFLMSIFPILIAILGIIGLVLGAISPEAKEQVISNVANGVANALPKAGPSGQSIGHSIVSQALASFTQSAGVLFLVGLIIALFTGSRVFVTLEKHFGVIFRLRGRDPLHQNLMAIGMMLLYTILVPVVLLGSTVPTAVISALHLDTSNPVMSLGYKLLGIVVGLVAAIILFGAIYIVVPNRPVKVNEVVKGTLVAAGLLVLYELLFPFYQSMFLKPGHYGAIVGYAIVLLVFFYYFGFILLVGAEVNSWAVGQRQTAAPLEGILHELQAHDTTRGAAGPTAGERHEDLQSGVGAAAMRDSETAKQHERVQHNATLQPPKYAETGVTGSGYAQEETGGKDAIMPVGGGANGGDREASMVGTRRKDSTTASTHAGSYPPMLHQPLTTRQRQAMGAFLAAGAVAIAPVVRFVVRYVSGADEHDGTAAMD